MPHMNENSCTYLHFHQQLSSLLTILENTKDCSRFSNKRWSQTPSKDMWHVRLSARLPVMPCQIKETQAAASHRPEYNNAAELQEGRFFCSWHAGNVWGKKSLNYTLTGPRFGAAGLVHFGKCHANFCSKNCFLWLDVYEAVSTSSTSLKRSFKEQQVFSTSALPCIFWPQFAAIHLMFISSLLWP